MPRWADIKHKVMVYINEHKYDDIIELPHPISSRHPRMGRLDRAAQFSAFAALTGYDSMVERQAMENEEKIAAKISFSADLE